MAIITKPVGGIFKGVPATITLNKSELSALASVSADSYFSVTTNWNKVILSYKSFDGNQQEIVEFNATLSSPTGFFDVSLTARNFFEIQVIKIIDFDGGIFIVPRSELVIVDFDVIFVTPPSSLSYTTPVIYTQNETITNNVPSVIGTVNSYSISPALPTGLTIDPTTGVISGTPTVAVAAANYIVTASNSGGPTTATINITVESGVSDEFWDVANKSGVGTVSVGANRLITKTSGGGSYDVNVLSLETITGDGYIEFPNSSLLNIGNYGVSVIGLAEQTSPNGGFQNIILGAFTVSNNWERVVNGSISSIISVTNPNDIVRIGRIGTEYYIKINDVIKTQVTINNTNPLKASISLSTTGTGVDNITVESAEVPVGDPIIWDLFLNGATTEADGGLIGASTAAYSFTKSNASKIANGADFKITYKFTDLVADWVHGISSVLTEESQSQFNFTGLTYQQSFLISYYRGVQQPNQSLSILNSPGENTLVIEKTGTNLTFTLNNTVVLSKTDYTEQLTVPAVRPWNVRALDSAYVEIISATNYINWDLLTGYQAGSLTITPTSGVSGGISLAGNDVAVKSDADKATGDFDYTFKFDWSAATSVVDMFAGVTGNNVTSGLSFYPNLTCIYGNGNNPDTAFLWHNGSSVGGTTQTLLSGVNTYRLKRVGTTITHYLNDVQIYSAASTSFTAYPSVRTIGNSVVTESYITEPVPSSFLSVSWQEVATSETAGWNLYGSNYYTFNDGANLIVQRLVNEPVRALGIIIIDGATPYPDGMEWVPTSITISGGNSSSSFTQIKTFTFARNEFTADTLKYLVLDSDQSFEFYKITLNSYDKTYGASFIFQGQISLHSAATAVQSVTWNVAGKTGVGTVTAGANGLITKATGGQGYNVNVLSNETITGNGYVEFIWSHTNVVFGIAETIHPSGSYTNIVYGGYNAGYGWEIVNIGAFNGSGLANNSLTVGDVVKIERVGNLFKAFKNGLLMHSCTINNLNPLKASISIHTDTNGVNGATISE